MLFLQQHSSRNSPVPLALIHNAKLCLPSPPFTPQHLETAFLERREAWGWRSASVPCQWLRKPLVTPALNRCWQIAAVSFGLLLNKLCSPFLLVSSIFLSAIRYLPKQADESQPSGEVLLPHLPPSPLLGSVLPCGYSLFINRIQLKLGLQNWPFFCVLVMNKAWCGPSNLRGLLFFFFMSGAKWIITGFKRKELLLSVGEGAAVTALLRKGNAPRAGRHIVKVHQLVGTTHYYLIRGSGYWDWGN